MTEKEIGTMREKILSCEKEIKKGIIGQERIIRDVIIAMLSGGNVLLEGEPGLGKTQLVKTVAKVCDLKFNRIQFTPDLMPADVTGTTLIVQEDGKNTFSFEEGPVFANMVLADEINRATPKTQSALLEAMAEHTVTTGKVTRALPSPFFVLATENPIENEGTYPLPEAQLDRFFFKLFMEYPGKEELLSIMNITVGTEVPEINKVLTGDDILAAREMIKNIPMSSEVASYAADVVLSTHPESEKANETCKKYVSCGASPRALQCIFMASKAEAFLNGRMNVSFDDVKEVAYKVLNHRVLLNYEGIADGIDIRKVIDL
ncbi:MAG: MoxR family ATPase [Lachnospiraceae bacterium]|jgi:MoxR-like ATPase|nr:MoxR family ATPase [Lachnospiraceae bacterium]